MLLLKEQEVFGISSIVKGNHFPVEVYVVFQFLVLCVDLWVVEQVFLIVSICLFYHRIKFLSIRKNWTSLLDSSV